MSARYLRDSANPLAERSFARASTEQKSPGKPRSLTSAFVALRASLLNVIGKARSQTEEDAERHEGGHRSVSKRHVRMPDEAENRPLATLVSQGVVVDEKRNAGFRLYEVMMESRSSGLPSREGLRSPPSGVFPKAKPPHLSMRGLRRSLRMIASVPQRSPQFRRGDLRNPADWLCFGTSDQSFDLLFISRSMLKTLVLSGAYRKWGPFWGPHSKKPRCRGLLLSSFIQMPKHPLGCSAFAHAF